MDTGNLKKFAQKARRELIEQVSARLSQVLAEDSLARREQPSAVKKLQKQIQEHGEQEVIERAAYTWFNRFCALRFMDANHYNRVGVVSPAEGQTQPEILAEAKSGHVDETMVPKVVRKRVLALLGGQEKSRDPQGQAYRLLLVAVCNHWHEAMSFMFERIADYTELLMPDDLLSEGAILVPMREAMTDEACQDVEIIGWLYQFYISEKKEEVFAALRKGAKITPENIPAATQLFTPHWIVRYLVENSLGRLWMFNCPNSRLMEQMDYYIKPRERDTNCLKIDSPEEIRICDPACGSGHMLTYAFDLLYAIYEEEGYPASEIPGKILTRNLFGIEIDERSGALAAFALMMKARGRQRRFFKKGIQPNICVLENVRIDEDELKSYVDFIGRELFTTPLQKTVRQFEEADNFGSLIRPRVTDVGDVVRMLESRDVSGQLFLRITHQKVLQALRQAGYLGQKYHVVIANPPYMGGNGLNGKLKALLQSEFPEGKSDLFSAFIIRNTEIALPYGHLGFMSPFVWMFISSYERLREFLITKKTLTSLVQLEYSGFDGATVPICTFTVENANKPSLQGAYIKLSDFRGSHNQGPRALEAIKNPDCSWFYRCSSRDFMKVPGTPIAFWISDTLRESFSLGTPLREIASPRKGMVTADNPRFVRMWHEVVYKRIGFGFSSRESAKVSSMKWFPYMKGGSFRRWSGNMESVVNWENDGYELFHMKDDGYKVGSTNHNLDFIFKPAITWTKITSSDSGFRSNGDGFLFDDASGLCPTHSRNDHYTILGLLNSPVAMYALRALNPTLNLNPGNLADIPVLDVPELQQARKCEVISKQDWDYKEACWDFSELPLLACDYRQPTLEATYQKLRSHWKEMTDEMQRLEEENNRIFIDAYGLQDELTPEVPIEEITLTCNPAYRYGVKGSEDDRETRLLADTMAEFLSYAVGCMFGRYSLDKPGLILANQGETLADYLAQVREPSFEPDDDNVIPILDAAWFTDGVVERFREFLKVTFGTEHYEENLEFIENALGKTIRKYFLNDFYKDHVRRYKKRPLYWLFSSPKGSFNVLIYMHRYRSDTVSVILNDYLREFRTKLEVRLANLEKVEASTDANKRDKTAAVKEINQIRITLDELEDWERKVMLPQAEQKIEIDLDDGVKANYPKFGDALKKIPGLST